MLYLGFLNGGITVGKHVSNHMLNKTEPLSNNKAVGDENNVTKET